jgi:hypothetical protein
MQISSKYLSYPILFSFLLFFSFISNAQSEGKIEGKINSQKGGALIGATISLFTIASEPLQVKSTDSTGYFLFSGLKNGIFSITISYTGYDTYRIDSIIIDNNNRIVVINQTLNPSGDKMQEVVVTSRKRYIEQRIDRTIVNVEENLANAGVTALDALKNAPGVTVDQNENLLLKSKAGVQVYIDDKPVNLSGDELASYLKSIPASTISKIELMTNPPARYEAEGTAGIINIRTKRSKGQGWTGSFSTSYGQGIYWKNTNSLNLSYKQGKINTFLNISYIANRNYRKINIARQFEKSDQSIESIFEQDSKFRLKREAWNLRTGFDYFLNKKNVLGLVFNYNVSPFEQDIYNSNYLMNAERQIDSTVLANNLQDSKSKNPGLNINYSHTWDEKGSSLNLNLDYIGYDYKNDQFFMNTTYYPNKPPGEPEEIIANLPSKINIYSFKADNSIIMENETSLDGGFKFSYVNSDNIASFFNIKNNIPIPDYNRSNQFKYEEYINAAYINFNKTLKQFTFQTGLRFENTISKGDQTGNIQRPDSSFKRNYSNLFPTIYMLYKLDSSSKHQLSFSYGRRIDRPYYQDMNPFITIVDRFTYFAGNPYLRPQFSDKVELSHIYNNTLTTTVFYNTTKDIRDEVIRQDGNIFISTFGNIGKRVTVGVNLSAYWQPVRWLITNFYTEVANTRFDAVISNIPIDINRTYWRVYLDNQFDLGKQWNVSMSVNYNTKNIQGQFLNDPLLFVQMGGGKKILKGKGSIRLNFTDIFYTWQPKGTINFIPKTRASFKNYFDSRVVNISFSYNFGSKDKVNRQRQSVDEENRIKTD